MAARTGNLDRKPLVLLLACAIVPAICASQEIEITMEVIDDIDDVEGIILSLEDDFDEIRNDVGDDSDDALSGPDEDSVGEDSDEIDIAGDLEDSDDEEDLDDEPDE